LGLNVVANDKKFTPRCKRGVAGRRDIIEIYFGISRLKRNNKLLLAHANKENWFGFFVVDSGFFC